MATKLPWAVEQHKKFYFYVISFFPMKINSIIPSYPLNPTGPWIDSPGNPVSPLKPANPVNPRTPLIPFNPVYPSSPVEKI